MDASNGRPLTPGGGASGPVGTYPAAGGAATAAVTELYQAHAVGLTRLAIVMLGDRAAAEDVVQDAFLGLYRHWAGLADPGNALAYVRSAVLNRCRNSLRQRGRSARWEARHADAAQAEAVAAPGGSAEAALLVGEEHLRVLAAIRALPDRQRAALVLRFYLDMTEAEAAQAMGISRGTVKSATSRAVAALGRMLREDS
jgi:RNA polymerase sigma-70 factor (sigma-E family)